MPGWLTQVLSAAVVGIVGAALIAVYRRWLAARRRKALAAGKPFRLDASLRGNISPYPRRFRQGWIVIGNGPPAWKPRFGVLRRPIELPTSAVVEQVRALSGLKEQFTVTRTAVSSLRARETCF
jgi:hypothetical protein